MKYKCPECGSVKDPNPLDRLCIACLDEHDFKVEMKCIIEEHQNMNINISISKNGNMEIKNQK